MCLRATRRKGMQQASSQLCICASARLVSSALRTCMQDGARPVLKVTTERGVSISSGGPSVFAVAETTGMPAAQRISHLAPLLGSLFQLQRGGSGQPLVLRAGRRLGPGHDTAGILRADDAAATVNADGDRSASLYRLSLAQSQQPQQHQRLFSSDHVTWPGSTLRVADSFDVDVDIELLPAADSFPTGSAEVGAWFAGALAGARSALNRAAERAAGLHAAARTWTCAHRRLLLAVLAAQLALTILLALAVRTCPEAAAKQRSGTDAGVVSAADEARAQLTQPLLFGHCDLDAANPMHGVADHGQMPVSTQHL